MAARDGAAAVRRFARSRIGLALAGCLAAYAIAIPAAAADVPPAIDQYVETPPSASGKHTSGQRSTRAPLGLSDPARHRLLRTGGADATALAELSTSSEFGAPQTFLRSLAGVDNMQLDRLPDRSVAAATAGAASDFRGGRVLVLGMLLLLATVAVVAAWRARRVRRHGEL